MKNSVQLGQKMTFEKQFFPLLIYAKNRFSFT